MIDAAQLARYGFRDPAAASRELDGDPRWPALLDRFRDTADPDGALRHLNLLGPPVVEAALADPEAAEPLIRALGFGTYLFDIMRRLDGLAIEIVSGRESDRADIRDLKDAELVRIAVTDLSRAPDRPAFEDTGLALARLGDACLDKALAGAPAGLAVMAMGKYGGCELNYASDIDVLFVYAEGPHEPYEAAARQVMETMNGPPTVFRTDADLRPQGRDGPLARSLEAFEAYYKRWAEVWEFQSLIKCRFAAGDAAVGERFLELVRPFVWPEALPADAVDQIRALKARAEREVARRGLGGRQVKLAPGGIRDVEFAVQLLQLVHGRDRPELRSANTLEALGVLGAEGYVGEEDAAELADAYVFLRHAEHRLQLVAGRQTHTLPKAARDRELLARGLGYRDTPDASALDAFTDDWKRRTAVVRRIHERLFYRPLLEAFGAAPAVGPTLPEAEARQRLSALGFDRPPRAQDAIVRLTSGGSRATKIMRAILPGLLQWLAETPDPDTGLARLADLTKALDHLPHLLSRLRDEPPAAELLCTALGTGPVLAEAIARDPSLVGALEVRDEPADPDALRREATSMVTRHSDAVASLRRFKETWWVRLAAQDLAAGEDPRAFVGPARDLSHVADACLEAAFVLARAEQDRRTLGPPAPGGFAVIGMGRLGGRELSYASDVDVLFVYEGDGLCPDGSEGRLYHSAVAERMVEILGDTPPIFKVDTELRPEGRSGAIVRSLDAYRHYYERWADLWEFQALLRARPSAGDRVLARRFLDAVAPSVWRGELTPEQLGEIRHIKARIERERVKARDRRTEVKLGVGGLADVEFTVQLLQMRHGRDVEAVRTPNTLEAIEALGAAGLIEPTDEQWLRDAYLLLNRVRNHMFLLRGIPTDALPTRDEELERLALSLGYGRRSRSRFTESYKRVTRRARKVTDRLFYGEDSA